MGKTYNQLTQAERYQIQAFCDIGHSARYIAKQLRRSNKTISKEIKRCPTNSYCAETGQHHAQLKRRQATRAQVCNVRVIQQVDELLHLGFSPEQISGRMRLENSPLTVGRQTIYRPIARQGWCNRLLRIDNYYSPRRGIDASKHLIPNRVDIDERPAVVNENSQLGHWEGDTVYCQDDYLVTLVERLSKLLLTAQVKNKTKKLVSKAVCKLLKPYKNLCKTITFDNGGKFTGDQMMALLLKYMICFAQSYHSWQRGLTENTNVLLRRYFPKGVAIGELSKQKI